MQYYIRAVDDLRAINEDTVQVGEGLQKLCQKAALPATYADNQADAKQVAPKSPPTPRSL